MHSWVYGGKSVQILQNVVHVFFHPLTVISTTAEKKKENIFKKGKIFFIKDEKRKKI